MKLCRQCGIEKSASEFWVRRWKTKSGQLREGLWPECKLCGNARTKAFYKKNPEKTAEYSATYTAKHKEKELVRLREWKRNNLDKLRPSRRAYHQANKARWAAQQAKRRAAEKQRTPVWADSDAIDFFYECCPEGCHVDHVVPLLGDIAAGFHIETNLQWLPWRVNLSKGNRL